MCREELVKFMMANFMISVQDAENLVEGLQKGYLTGKCNYAMVLGERDRRIESIEKEFKDCLVTLSEIKHLTNDVVYSEAKLEIIRNLANKHLLEARVCES
ncbi:hypothetical protein FZC76_21715 [Sutcliffiella horikoshii]|uniref:Uncharacterized protein n=1 Tax=Sutcliffiella horikoshii TaxID=79883 RepID=A0A5D4SCX6_9BACI|nr:hypothetical protein [Sutcliffiella horikoshii]TYS60491.1 hypothetical protein FZC76_21715 [Sutcliffiella horikoshii]